MTGYEGSLKYQLYTLAIFTKLLDHFMILGANFINLGFF